MVCASVLEDNLRALASLLAPVHTFVFINRTVQDENQLKLLIFLTFVLIPSSRELNIG